MSDTTSQQWLWTDPLPEATSGVIHELRMPVVSMRNAIDLIQQLTSCQAYQLQPIFTMVETNSHACLEAIQSLLHGGLLQRLSNEQGLGH
jgi:hypothetical protein